LRYFFHIGYNGTNYSGWQNLPQTRGANLQYVIESNLSKILKSKVTIVGCGRTDSHVHARQFFFHVDINKQWDYDLLFRLNKNLPPDIAVFDIIPVDEQSHARFDAIERTYHYFIHTYKDPHINDLSACYLEKDLDLDKMKKAAALLLKYEDYSPFTKNIPTDKPTLCKVTQADLYSDENVDHMRFEITANRFLNGMIRIIVNKLLMIGRSEMSIDEFQGILVSKKKPKVNRLAYPQGLYLMKVKYPYLDIPTRSQGFLRAR